MNAHRITVEHTLYTLALLVALLTRLLNLGSTPLSDSEAGQALQAWQVAVGQPADVGPQSAYVVLTGGLFMLLGSSEALARLWPALAGALLVLTPFLFRRLLGNKAALLLAFGLALDPWLVAMSRVADGPMMALGFGLFGLGLAFVWLPSLAGIFIGLALLCGLPAVPGLLGLTLAWLAGRLLARGRPLFPGNGTQASDAEPNDRQFAWKTVLLSVGFTLLLVGTMFGRLPNGLNGWIESLPIYLVGWTRFSGLPALRLMVAIPSYQPLGLLFGLAAVAGAWLPSEREIGSRIAVLRWISLWWIIALVLAAFYPSRQPGDLVWTVIPLWCLAAVWLSNFTHLNREACLVSLGQAALIFTLLVVTWLNLAAGGFILPGLQANLVRLATLAGLLSLAGLTTLLVALGWSWDSARRGLVWGLTASLGLYVLANTWTIPRINADQWRPARQELWSTLPIPGDADLFVSTLGDLAEWSTGRRDGIDIVVAVDSPSLHWVLRDFPRVRYVEEGEINSITGGLASGELPSILVTRLSGQAPQLSAAYRGQDFSWWSLPDLNSALPPDYLHWIVFRDTPVTSEQIVLWARSDLFLGDSLVSPEGTE